MAGKDNYKIDKEDFLGGFQEVFDMNNDNQISSAKDSTEEVTGEIEPGSPEDGVREVDPSFFQQESEDESQNDEEENNEEENESESKQDERETETEEASEEEREEKSQKKESGNEQEEEETGGDSENEEDDSGVDENEQDEETIVDSFFDLFAQELGWEYDENSKPKSINGLVDFMNNLVQEASESNFASEEVKQINDYIANGGTVDDFVQNYSKLTDVENLDIENDEEAQKKVIRDQLTKQGLSEDIIEKRIERYEDTGILKDEAEESQELLKKYNEKEKEELLKEQENKRKQREQEQQKFINDVKSTIDEYKDIKGVPLTKQKKEDLKKYLFEVGSDGKTQYQKDFSQSYDKLIEAAFFIKEGDDIVNKLQKKAGSDATKDLRKKLNKKTTKRSKNQTSQSSQSSSALDMISTISKNLSN